MAEPFQSLEEAHSKGKRDGRDHFDAQVRPIISSFKRFDIMVLSIQRNGRHIVRQNIIRNIETVFPGLPRHFVAEYGDGFAEGIFERFDELQKEQTIDQRLALCERMFTPDNRCNCTATHTAYDPPVRFCTECLADMKASDVFSAAELATIREISR